MQNLNLTDFNKKIYTKPIEPINLPYFQDENITIVD